MSYVMIRHKVANYAKWKREVKAFAKFRKASGEKCFYVSRSNKSPNNLLVWCAWDTSAKLKKFLKSSELVEAMKAAGVTSKPEVAIFDKLEDLTVA